MKDLSILIVHWNTWDDAAACVRSVAQSAYAGSYEILFIDNASTEDRCEAFRAQFSRLDLQVVRNASNVGFAKACNQGMALARGRNFLLLNPDTLVREDTIARSVDFFDAQPAAGILGIRLLNTDGTLQRWTAGSFPSIRTAFNHYFFLSILLAGVRGFDGLVLTREPAAAREVDWVCGAYMLARRAAVEAVGGMNEDYFLYAEDMDWCYRMKRGGWKVLYDPGTEVIHHSGRSLEQWSRDRYAIGIYSISRFYRSCGGTGFRLTVFNAVTAAGYLLRTLVYGAAGIVRGFKDTGGKTRSSWNFFKAACRVLFGRYRSQRG